MEFWWAVIALGGVVLLGTLEGILVAVAISLLDLIYQANHPPVYALARKRGTDFFRPRSEEHPDDETFPGRLLVRTEGRMTFASAPRVGEKLLPLIDQKQPKVVALDCSSVPDFEYTALAMLTTFEEKLREAGVELWLVALNPEPLKGIRNAPLGEVLGTGRMFFNLEQAVERYLKRN
jgi:sulfate permease, SulP family